MADSTIPNLDAVITPASTDLVGVRQSGDTRDKKQSRAQLHALQSGEHLVLPQVDEPATPTLAFGNGDSGWYEPSDDLLRGAVGGFAKIELSSTAFSSLTSVNARLRISGASITQPAFTFRDDTDTGVSRAGADHLALVAGTLDCITVREVASARQIGFYVTAPVALQTGVAVTAAGVHAALVNLGLITA